MPNPTDPDRCPSCRAEMHPLAEHTCPRTKAPSARELEARVKSLEAGEVERDLTIENLQERMEGLEVTLHALAANHENTGVARGDGSARQPLDSRGSPAPEQGDRGTKHGEPSTQALGELRSVEACGKEPATVAYKLTDEERMAFWRMLDETGFDAADVEAHVESLVTRAVRGERERCVRFLKRRASTEYQGHDQVLAWAALGSAADAIEHGGGLDRNATPREGRCPSPAAAALPMPERPCSLDNPWHVSMFSGTGAKSRCENANDERKYALALESRLAEGEKHRDHLLSLLKHSASRGERLLADRDALKAKLAEKSEQLEALTETHDELLGKHAAMQMDRDALRAKLDEAERFWRDVAHVVGVEHAADGHATQPGPMDTVLDAVKENVASVPRLEEANDRLRAKLAAMKRDAKAETEGMLALRSKFGARGTETWAMFLERVSGTFNAVRDERDRLRAKLAAAESNLEHARMVFAGVGVALDGGDVSHAKFESREFVNVLERSVALRAKLDGVREAAEKWTFSVGDQVSFWDAVDTFAKAPPMSGARMDAVVRVNRAVEETVRKLITSALAAAENTNTKQGRAYAADQVGGQPIEPPATAEEAACAHGTTNAGSGPDAMAGSTGAHLVAKEGADTPGVRAAGPSPSPAPAFEMTKKQRDELWVVLMRWQHAFVRTDSNLSRYCDAEVAEVDATVTDLVRTALRDSREGWVTRDVAIAAMNCYCKWHGETDACPHSHASACLSSAERDAASKGADSFRAESSPND